MQTLKYIQNLTLVTITRKVNTMKQILLLIMFCFTSIVYAYHNDTIYLDDNYQVNTNEIKKKRIVITSKKETYFVSFQECTNRGKWKKIKNSFRDIYKKRSTNTYVKKLFMSPNELTKFAKIAAKYFVITESTPEKSYVKIYSIDSTLISEGYYTNLLAGIKVGQHKVYYPDGKIWRIQEYHNNLLVKSENYLTTGIKGHSDCYEVASKLPLFRGQPFRTFEDEFWQYIYNTPGIGIDVNNKYLFDGLCVTSFVITSKGEFVDFQIIKAAPNNSINALVRKYLYKYKDQWTPAVSSGKPVNFIFQWNLNYTQD